MGGALASVATCPYILHCDMQQKINYTVTTRQPTLTQHPEALCSVNVRLCGYQSCFHLRTSQNSNTLATCGCPEAIRINAVSHTGLLSLPSELIFAAYKTQLNKLRKYLPLQNASSLQ